MRLFLQLCLPTVLSLLQIFCAKTADDIEQNGIMVDPTVDPPVVFIYVNGNEGKFGPRVVDMDLAQSVLNGSCGAEMQPPANAFRGKELHLEFCLAKEEMEDCLSTIHSPGSEISGFLFCFVGRLDTAYSGGQTMTASYRVDNLPGNELAAECEQHAGPSGQGPWHALLVELVVNDEDVEQTEFRVQTSFSKMEHFIKTDNLTNHQQQVCFSLRLGPQLVTEAFTPSGELLAAEPTIMERRKGEPNNWSEIKGSLMNGGLLSSFAGLWLVGMDMIRGLDEQKNVLVAGFSGQCPINAKLLAKIPTSEFANCESFWKPVKAARTIERQWNRGVMVSKFTYFAVRVGNMELEKLSSADDSDEQPKTNMTLLLNKLHKYVKITLPAAIEEAYAPEESYNREWIKKVQPGLENLENADEFFYVDVPTDWNAVEESMNTKNELELEMLFHQCTQDGVMSPLFASLVRKPLVKQEPAYDWSEDLELFETCELKWADHDTIGLEKRKQNVLRFKIELGFEGAEHAGFNEQMKRAIWFKLGLSDKPGVIPRHGYLTPQEDGIGLSRFDQEDVCFGHYIHSKVKIRNKEVEERLLPFQKSKVLETVDEKDRTESETELVGIVWDKKEKLQIRQQYFDCNGKKIKGKFWLPFLCALNADVEEKKIPIEYVRWEWICKTLGILLCVEG